MLAALAILSATLLIGVVVAVGLVRSTRLALWGRASLLTDEFAHSPLALAVGLMLCLYASFTVWATHVPSIHDTSLAFGLGALGGVWCAVMYCAWMVAHAVSAGRTHARSWTLALCALLVWAGLLFLAQFGPLQPLLERALQG